MKSNTLRKTALGMLTLGAVVALGTVPVLATTAYADPGPNAPIASQFPDSIFNQQVTSWPVDSNSSAIVSNLVSDAAASGYGLFNEQSDNTIWVPADQPMVPVSVKPNQSNCNATGITEAPIPSWAPSNSGDSILTIYQPSANNGQGEEWEFWEASAVNTGQTEYFDGNTSLPYTANDYSGWQVCWGGTMNMSTSTGVFPSPYGADAAGTSIAATEITQGDILSGSINHAIGAQLYDLAYSSEDFGSGYYVYPADRDDTNSPYEGDANQPSEGTWFRLSPSVNCASYDTTKLENMVCVAAQTYGIVADDYAGSDNLNIQGDQDWCDMGETGTCSEWYTLANGWSREAGGTDPIDASQDTTAGNPETQAQGYAALQGLPWSQLQVVDPPGYGLNVPPTTTTTLAIDLQYVCQGGENGELTWNNGPGTVYANYVSKGTQTSPYVRNDSDGITYYVVVNGVQSSSVTVSSCP